MTPAFLCTKDYELLNVKKGEMLKMSAASVEELDADERFKSWRKFFKELNAEEEREILNKQ